MTTTSEASSTAAATLYIVYTKTGTNNTSSTFTQGETISGTTSEGTAFTAVVGTSGTSLPTSSNATGKASAVKVEEGVYFINGFFVKNSEETLTDFEGCLSAPGKRGEVKRYLRIVLKYQDKEGAEHQKTFYDLEARCIQHEMDHLEGKLCIDYEKGEYSRDKHKSQTMVESDFRVKSDS